jgi:hypothetical protein
MGEPVDGTVLEYMDNVQATGETVSGTCNKFCVNGYTTLRRKYGLFKRDAG